MLQPPGEGNHVRVCLSVFDSAINRPNTVTNIVTTVVVSQPCDLITYRMLSNCSSKSWRTQNLQCYSNMEYNLKNIHKTYTRLHRPGHTPRWYSRERIVLYNAWARRAGHTLPSPPPLCIRNYDHEWIKSYAFCQSYEIWN